MNITTLYLLERLPSSFIELGEGTERARDEINDIHAAALNLSYPPLSLSSRTPANLYLFNFVGRNENVLFGLTW
jgi:hypothetical protein